MLNNLAGVPWKRGTGASLGCSSDVTGVTRNLQAVIKIHFQILFLCQEIHQLEGKCEIHVLLFTSTCYEHKHVSDQSMRVFCFRGDTFVVYLETTEVHKNSVFKELTLFFLLQKSHL